LIYALAAALRVDQLKLVILSEAKDLLFASPDGVALASPVY
jgi:hypothetical protein